ncbi:Mediator of RNA polymerase II transcription subunit 15 [Halotydeus destructor]|nr:Mediator of RNA polymerase II transcription subunit 15 [Halotydeus destructor]
MDPHPDVWKTDQFRNSIRSKLDDVMKQMQLPANMTGALLEGQIYNKIEKKENSKEAYINAVKIILNNLRTKAQQQQSGHPGMQQQQPMGQPGQPMQPQGQPMQQQMSQQSDPMSALQTLASSQSASDMQQSMTQMQMQSDQGQPQQQMMMSSGQQQGHPGMRPGMAPGIQRMRQAGQMMPGMQPGQPMMQSGQGGHGDGFPQYQMAPGQVNQGMPHGGQQQFQGQMQQQQFNHQQHPGMMQQGVQHHPGQMGPGMNAMASMAQTPSPYGPSPSGGLMSSPMNPGMQQRPPPSVNVAPSPVSLNTPMMTATGSPMNRPTVDQDHAYLEKLKQLSKFIEPLRKQIARIEREESMQDKKKDMSKITNLLKIVSDPSARVPMDVLLKCEQVLERMDFGCRRPEILSVPAPVSVSSQQHNICQPLLDAIIANIKKPNFNQALHATFAPAVSTLTGITIPFPSPNTILLKAEEFKDSNEIVPEVIQGEIARLDTKFKVQLDPLQQEGSTSIKMICRLDDLDLPSVPPMSIRVPEGYPKRPPHFYLDEEDYSTSTFLSDTKRIFDQNVRKLAPLHSVTSLLHTWEMSVRQASTQDIAIVG